MIEGAHCLSPVYKIKKKNSFIKISAKHKKDENFDFFLTFFE